MFRRAIVVLISILSCCALICVGFSSWSFMEELREISDASSGNLSSENVILSDEYVFADVANMEKEENFTMTKYGFSHGSSTNYQGSFTVPFYIDVENCKKLAGTGNSLTVQVTLRFEDNQALGELFKGSGKVTFALDGAVDLKPNSTDRAFIAEFTLLTDSLTANDATNEFSVQVGTFSFNLTEDVYTQMYLALKIDEEAENDDQRIGNPFVIVVSVINTPTP